MRLSAGGAADGPPPPFPEEFAMATVPEPKPNRIDPREPPGVAPPRTTPVIPRPPESEPVPPDIDEPDRCPPETPSPD